MSGDQTSGWPDVGEPVSDMSGDQMSGWPDVGEPISDMSGNQMSGWPGYRGGARQVGARKGVRCVSIVMASQPLYTPVNKIFAPRRLKLGLECGWLGSYSELCLDSPPRLNSGLRVLLLFCFLWISKFLLYFSNSSCLTFSKQFTYQFLLYQTFCLRFVLLVYP